MDAHVFRRFCTVLTGLLHEARLEKIQSPAADVHIFTFYAQQRKHILVVRHDRRNPLLFLSPERYSTGQAPPASTMRLRKYAAGRRVKDMRVDWTGRRLHLCFQLATPPDSAPEFTPDSLADVSIGSALIAQPAPSRALPKYLSETTCPDLAGAEHFYVGTKPYIPQPETWISLDLRQGPELTLGKAPDFGQEALWPSPTDLATCLYPLALPRQGQTGVQAQTQAQTQAQAQDQTKKGGGAPASAVPDGDAAGSDSQAAGAQAWEQWPVLTPALRRSLVHLDALEQAALLADLEYGGGDIFAYSVPQSGESAPPDPHAAVNPANLDAKPVNVDTQKPASASAAPMDLVAWPLPPAVRGARHEQIFEDPVEALALVGTCVVFGGLERAGQHSAATPHKREAKRLSRVLEKLEREESRLRAMVAGKDRALYIQSVLWYFLPDARPADLAQSPAWLRPPNAEPSHAPVSFALDAGPSHTSASFSVDAGPSHTSASCTPADQAFSACIGEGAELPPCPFDPALLQAHLSLRENMEALFHGAARGQRGLAMLEQRRALLRGQVTAAHDAAYDAAHLVSLFGGLSSASSGAGGKGGLAKTAAQKPPQAKGGQVGKKSAKQAAALNAVAGQRILPKNVEAFTSVDGLVILRGKDAKGNLALLKLGAPSDLWLHVEGGPGAHTLVRRASVGQEVPQATLEQAATLAAVKSWQKGNERVGVQCAEVRHVKPMRGAAMGTVRIDKVACMVWVNIPLQTS